MISAVLAATVLLFQATAAADHPAATPGKSVTPLTVNGQGSHASVEAGGTIVCHDEVRLGSLFPKRVCAHKDEMIERTRSDQMETRSAQTPFEVIPLDAKR